MGPTKLVANAAKKGNQLYPNVHLTYFCYYAVYFCYYLWVLLHFFVLFMVFTIPFQLPFSFVYGTFSKKFSISVK